MTITVDLVNRRIEDARLATLARHEWESRKGTDGKTFDERKAERLMLEAVEDAARDHLGALCEAVRNELIKAQAHVNRLDSVAYLQQYNDAERIESANYLASLEAQFDKIQRALRFEY